MNRYLKKAIAHYENNLNIFQQNKNRYIASIKYLENEKTNDNLYNASFLSMIMRADGISWSDVNCPLCIKYSKKGCCGCPIAKKGHYSCKGTPWTYLNYNIMNETDVAEVWISKIEMSIVDELSFLKSLKFTI